MKNAKFTTNDHGEIIITVPVNENDKMDVFDNFDKINKKMSLLGYGETHRFIKNGNFISILNHVNNETACKLLKKLNIKQVN